MRAHIYECTRGEHTYAHTYESTKESTHVKAERRKTDPKTWKHTLCEPAQSKRTWTCHKSRFVEMYKETAAHYSDHLD